jgi:hypothetical protein
MAGEKIIYRANGYQSFWLVPVCQVKKKRSLNHIPSMTNESQNKERRKRQLDNVLIR